MRSRGHTTMRPVQSKDGGVVLALPKGDSNHNNNASTNNNNESAKLRLQRNAMLASCMVLLLLLFRSRGGSYYDYSVSIHSGLKSSSSPPPCRIHLGDYRGPVYRSVESGTLGEPQCLLDSKWMRVSLHTVKFPGSDTTFDDWLWIDYHDRINVLVEDERRPPAFGEEESEPRFLVFEQTKYALEGRNSLAIIGGIIEDGEDPVSAARREVAEEMNGLYCEKFEFLGRHRTDVNRGMGWLNGFLARQCTRAADSKSGGQENPEHLANEVGVADIEQQNLKSISLAELKDAVTHGKFIEVQWTATVAQAIVKFYAR